MKNKLFGIITAAVSTTAAATLMAMSAFAEDAEASGSSTATASGGSVFWTLIFPLIIMFLLLYFVAIKPQKKREKEMKDMQESIQIGDEVVTGGGIVGIVVRTGDDTVVIETGGEKYKLRIKTWAITENVTAAERMREAKASAKNAGLAAAKLSDDNSDEKPEKKKKSKEKDTEEE